MASKKVPDLPHGIIATATEIHIVEGVVRDGAGNITNGGNSRRATVAELLALVPAPALIRLITVQVIGLAPSAAEILGLYPAADAFTLPANLAGSKVSVITNPTAVFVISIARQVNGAGAFTEIATISIATDGAVTRATVGGTAKAIAAGDVIRATADVDGDASFIGAATIVGH